MKCCTKGKITQTKQHGLKKPMFMICLPESEPLSKYTYLSKKYIHIFL